jgi:DNA-binding XRE family transcriptional regulator
MKGDLQLTVRRNLQAYRKARGLSQEAFADVLKVHRTYMGGIERGERNLIGGATRDSSALHRYGPLACSSRIRCQVGLEFELRP